MQTLFGVDGSSNLYMDAAIRALDVSDVPSNIVNMMLQCMSLSDRFTCALVCKAWAEEATAATRSTILRDRIQDFNSWQRWMKKHGHKVEVLQLYRSPEPVMLTALPCPQLQDLLLGVNISLDSRVWSNIAAATQLTSVSETLGLERVETASQQAEVVSALTVLPDLEQLTWRLVACAGQWGLTDSMLLHKLTKLKALQLDYVAEAGALEHLGLLIKLQDLSLTGAADWAAAGCPGLQELKALTRLVLVTGDIDLPPSVSQLTALQQLDVPRATPTALKKLQVLTGLTWLGLQSLEELWPGSPPLQLPGLQRLDVDEGYGIMAMPLLACCTKLQVLQLSYTNLSGPGSLVASSILQHLELHACRVIAADGLADPGSWQEVFPGPGRLPHLTSLRLINLWPDLQHADLECVTATCCSRLQVLHLETLPDDSASALACLPGLTSLTLWKASDQQCSSFTQLTGLRELRVLDAAEVFAAGLRQLAVLEHLTKLELLISLGWSSDVLREHMSDTVPRRLLDGHAIINKAPAGQPPDVSARLRRAIDLATADS